MTVVAQAAAAPPRGRLGVEFAASILRHLVSAAAGLVVIPLVGHRLGAESLAAWALLGTASFVLGVADLGTTVSVQRAALSGTESHAARALGISLGVVSSTVPFLFGIAWLTLDLPDASASLRQDLALAAPIALSAGVASALALPIRGLLLVRGGVVPIAHARTAGALLQVGGTAGLILVLPSVVAPSLALLAANVAELLVLARALSIASPEVRIRPVRPAFGELVALLQEGGASLAINVAVMASLRLDLLILAHSVPLVAVAGYGVASRAVDQSFTVAKQVSAPLMSRLRGNADRARSVGLGTAVLGALVGSGMVGLALAGRPLLVAWAGEAADDPACQTALVLLGGAAVLSSLTEVPASALTLTGKSAWQVAWPMVLGAVLNVGTSLLLVPHLGALGVALGTVLGSSVVVVVVWVRARTLLEWSIGTVARALAPAPTAVISAAVTAGLLATASVSPLGALLVAGASTLVGTGAGLTVGRALGSVR
jgi:O-antigen/teichoic acid export membrane protein